MEKSKTLTLLFCSLALVTCSLVTDGTGEDVFGSATGGGGATSSSADVGAGGGGGSASSANGGSGGSSPCTPGNTIVCFTGPSENQSKGACHDGTQTCLPDGSDFGPCEDEVVPVPENCATPVDDDCDSEVNEGCECEAGTTAACYTGPAGTADVGICQSGTQTCDADGLGFGPCTGDVVPSIETCLTPEDEDCDGAEDEGCICTPGATQPCYSGPQGTNGVGTCKSGQQTCSADGLSWGPCVGEVLPAAMETCDGLDDDCEGAIDNMPIVQLTTLATATQPKIAVASDGTLGFVWVMQTLNQPDKAFIGTADFEGTRIVGDTPLPPRIVVANGYTRAPSIVANGTTFAAAYADGSKGNDINFATMNLNGIVTLSPNIVNGGGTATGETNIATDGTKYFVAWDDTPPGSQPTIYQGVWNGAGVLSGGGALTSVIFSTIQAQTLAYGGKFTTCWRQDVNGSPLTYCRDVNTSAVPQGVAFQIALGTAYGLRIGQTGNGPTTAWRASNPSAVYFAQFNNSFASPITSFVYTQQGVTVDTMGYAWNGSTHAFAIVHTTGQDHTVGVILRDSMGVLSPEVILTSWQGNVGDVRIAWDATNNRWVLVWDQETQTGRQLLHTVVCGG